MRPSVVTRRREMWGIRIGCILVGKSADAAMHEAKPGKRSGS